MKKFLFLATAAAMTFSGCMKGDSSYEETMKVQPGIYIYSATSNQNNFSTIPADIGVRVAMLVAQAELTPPANGDISLVWVDGKNIKNELIGANTKIEKQGDDYVLTYTEGSQTPSGYYLAGKVTVKTNGKLPIDTDFDNAWEITYETLKAIVYSNDGSSTTVHFASDMRATSKLYSAGDGSYTINVDGMRLNINQETCYSDWVVNFRLTPPDESLAYSKCTEKDFKLNGAASGPTFNTMSTSGKSVELRLEVNGGLFRNGSRMIGGKETCTIESFDYDKTFYVSPSVEVEWSVVDNYLRGVLRYNGFSYQM